MLDILSCVQRKKLCKNAESPVICVVDIIKFLKKCKTSCHLDKKCKNVEKMHYILKNVKVLRMQNTMNVPMRPRPSTLLYSQKWRGFSSFLSFKAISQDFWQWLSLLVGLIFASLPTNWWTDMTVIAICASPSPSPYSKNNPNSP